MGGERVRSVEEVGRREQVGEPYLVRHHRVIGELGVAETAERPCDLGRPLGRDTGGRRAADRALVRAGDRHHAATVDFRHDVAPGRELVGRRRYDDRSEGRIGPHDRVAQPPCTRQVGAAEHDDAIAIATHAGSGRAELVVERGDQRVGLVDGRGEATPAGAIDEVWQPLEPSPRAVAVRGRECRGEQHVGGAVQEHRVGHEPARDGGRRGRWTDHADGVTVTQRNDHGDRADRHVDGGVGRGASIGPPRHDPRSDDQLERIAVASAPLPRRCCGSHRSSGERAGVRLVCPAACPFSIRRCAERQRVLGPSCLDGSGACRVAAAVAEATLDPASDRQHR